MKLICFILSVYILILATVPFCSDSNCGDEVKLENVAGPGQEHQDDECNSCSEFLSCGSCAGFVFLNHNAFKVFLAVETFIQFNTFLATPDFSAKIWQPPDLS